MKWNLMVSKPDQEGIVVFYKSVRDDESARNWHRIYTPWFEESELDIIIKDYDYEGIKKEFELITKKDAFTELLYKQ